MSICADKDWTMDLVKDNESPNEKETFNFRDIRVVNGVLTGRVYDAKNLHYSYLWGSCFSLGPVAHMTFFFTAVNDTKYVDIVLSGVGFQLPGEQPRFNGRFEVLERPSQLQSEVPTGFDPGDTGTG